MDAHTDLHLTLDDTGQNALVENLTTDHGHEPGTASTEDSPEDKPDSPSLNVPATDSSDTKASEETSSIYLFKSDQEPSAIQVEGDETSHEYNCICPQSNSDQVVLSAIPEEMSTAEFAVVPFYGPTSSISAADTEATRSVYPEELQLLCECAVSEPSRNEREADPVDERPKSIQVPQLDHVTDEEETREDFNHPCDDRPPSLPPSSSPPRLFSSSPCASSQSSVGDVELSKTVLAATEAEGCRNTDDLAQGDRDIQLVAQGDSYPESEYLHNRVTTEVATSSETIDCCSQMGPSTSCTGLGLSGKRSADPDESYTVKRPKLDSCLYSPPAPKRATITSQHNQLKKLATPFRPPSKLPIVMDGLASTMNGKKVEPAISKPETHHDKIEPKRSLISFQHKASNTSRSVSQFKSPLVNKVLPADSRTIRLTPALQALERKLQLLKRAIKLKDDNEEEVLVKLAGKWIEAGREVAYEVWDATKDSGDFTGKATSVRRSYGWENSNDGNTPWGWDTRPGDAGEESCDLDTSQASCAAGRLDPQEDDAIGYNTLGTLLRQLGIAPETLGWDDEKEMFSD